MPADLKTSPVQSEVWHVGFRPEPLAWAGWQHAEGGRFSGRWDDPAGTWRTKYVGETFLSCLLEVLAHFRSYAPLQSALDEIVEENQDQVLYPTIDAGTVPRSWLDPRIGAHAAMRGIFCEITAMETIAALHRRFVGAAGELGLADFDAAALKDGRPRELTQAVSAYIYAATDVDGLQFTSRHGDDLTLWAIYERPGDPAVSPCLRQGKSIELDENHPDLLEAFRLLNLGWKE